MWQCATLYGGSNVVYWKHTLVEQDDAGRSRFRYCDVCFAYPSLVYYGDGKQGYFRQSTRFHTRAPLSATVVRGGA